jgi:hypothetical protein
MAKVSQKVLFLVARSMALYKGRYSSIYHISQLYLKMGIVAFVVRKKMAIQRYEGR